MRRLGLARGLLAAVAAAGSVAISPTAATAAALPDIRLSERNPVPACATPERLMRFLKARNGRLDPRYKTLAALYQRHGEPWRVRWDYAFFQMAVETNFLTYRRPDGTMGDVDPRQNNFAGIGTTGGGVPGDSYPDIETGVLAHIQHLVVYSGESIATPIAPRTQLKQESILKRSRALNRPVRFSDLAGRWAADKQYDQTIARIADSFRTEHCRERAASPAVPPAERPPAAVRTIWSRGDTTATRTSPAAVPQAAAVPAPAPQPQAPASAPEPATPASDDHAPRFALLAPPAFPLSVPASKPRATALPLPVRRAGATGRRTPDAAMPPPSGLGMKPSTCRIDAASYGGTTTVLIRSGEERAPRYTALSVLDGFEASMTTGFIRANAPGGQAVGTFPSKDAALAKARELCPGS